MLANTNRSYWSMVVEVNEEDIQSTATIHSKTFLCLIAFLICSSSGVNADGLITTLPLLDSALFERLGLC